MRKEKSFLFRSHLFPKAENRLTRLHEGYLQTHLQEVKCLTTVKTISLQIAQTKRIPGKTGEKFKQLLMTS